MSPMTLTYHAAPVLGSGAGEAGTAAMKRPPGA